MKLEEQREIITTIEACYKQARTSLEDSQRKFDDFKRMIGLPRSYLDFKAASIGLDGWKGNYIFNLMMDMKKQNIIMIRQSAHDIRVFTEDTVRRMNALLNEFTEVLLRNR